MRNIFIYIPFVKSTLGPKIAAFVTSSNKKGSKVTGYGLTRLLNKICDVKDKQVRKCNSHILAYDIYINGQLLFRVEQKQIDDTQFTDVPNAKINQK